MRSLTESWYHAKKAYSLYPGVITPISGSFLAAHYARRRIERGMGRRLLDAIVGVAFLAWIPIRARQVQKRFGLPLTWRASATAIARARFADPNDIALFRIGDARDLDHYIRRFEDAGVNKRINPQAWSVQCALADKIGFYDRCAEHGLRHPKVFATLRGPRVTLHSSPGECPLLLKPARGEGGRGVQLLAPTAPQDETTFARWLRGQVGRLRGDWLVQQRILPHPDLAALALDALPTARMTTILNEQGEPELVNAVLRFPSRSAIPVDNMKAGGLLSPVGLEDGSLGVACRGYGGGDVIAHPVTGAVIAGRLLPDWPTAVALVQLAHSRAFSDYTLIGWDVGFAADGPILIEGNGKPGVLMPQRAGRRGLGDQRYGELLAFHLQRS